MSLLKKMMLRGRTQPGPANTLVNEGVDNTEDRNIDGERGIPSVSRRKSPTTMRYASMGFMGLAAVALLVAINDKPSTDKDKKGKSESEKNARVENRLPPLDMSSLPSPKKPETEPAVPNVASGKPAQPINVIPSGKGGAPVPNVAGGAPAGTTSGGKRVLTPEEQWRARRMGGHLVAYEGGVDTKASANVNDGGNDGPATPFLGPQMGNGGDELSGKLRTVSTPDARAMTLFDRNYLIAKGSTIDCTLETRLVSTVPGMIRCVAAHDVYSDNGNVLLMERGTVFTGTQQGGLKQGQSRIFALWERAKTPKGVIINLASPGADPLGGSGLPGYVDRHFWERFGGAIMLSIIMDVTDQGNSNNQNGQNTIKAGGDAVSEALRNSINIPPTLYKNHGESIMIYVARDLDFRTVYSLESASGDSRSAAKQIRKVSQ